MRSIEKDVKVSLMSLDFVLISLCNLNHLMSMYYLTYSIFKMFLIVYECFNMIGYDCLIVIVIIVSFISFDFICCHFVLNYFSLYFNYGLELFDLTYLSIR